MLTGRRKFNKYQKAKRSDTSESWVSLILFVMNLERLSTIAKDFLLYFKIAFFQMTSYIFKWNDRIDRLVKFKI
ncbi:unnamed protein product, partial [marine sediment metagenome]